MKKSFSRFADQQQWKLTMMPNGLEVYLGKRKSKWIEYFDKTPEGIFCPHFHVLAASSGSCGLLCKGCYLRGTYRGMRDPSRPVLYTNLDDMQKEVEKWLNSPIGLAVLNDGERGDSLLYDPWTKVGERLIPLFAKQVEKRFLRVTKSCNVYHLLDLDHKGKTILSYSVNCPEAAAIFEGRTPPMQERFQAALSGQQAGYETRFRFDPAIPVLSWEDSYRRTFEAVANLGLKPTVITLGTPRKFRAVDIANKLWGLKDMEVGIELVKDGTDGRFRLPEELRADFLGRLIEMAREIFPFTKIGLCKETVDLRQKLGFDDTDIACNCTI